MPCINNNPHEAITPIYKTILLTTKSQTTMCQLCHTLTELNKQLSTMETKLQDLSKKVETIESHAPKKVYTVKEAAGLIGKSAYTVSEWCRQGKLKATRTGVDGMWFITHDTIINFTTQKLAS